MSSTQGSTASSSSAQTERAALIQAVVKTIIERQGETVQRIANETVDGIMQEKEDSIMEEVEERLRKQKRSPEPKLANEGNKDQYKHQKAILETIKDVERALEKNRVEEAKLHLEKGKKIVERRIKLIRLADREDWATVKEYVSDDLASDTEDEKVLAKAIKARQTKKEKLKKDRFKQTDGSYKSSGAARRLFSTRLTYRKFGRVKNTITCWGCGRIGHSQRQCYSTRDHNAGSNYNDTTYYSRM